MKNDQLKKISVIIPVYNVKNYVGEAIESVINQTYKNLEIIIIDDGSNDGSEIICDIYSKIDLRIKVIHQQNKGLSAARNIGLSCMTGEYVAFLDSDDAFHPQMLEKLYNSIIKSDVDCAICNYTSRKTVKSLELDGKMSQTLKLLEGLYNKKEICGLLIDGKVNCSVWNKLYKKSLWDDIRFPTGHVYEDVLTIFKILEKSSKVCVLNESLMIYRIHNESITHKFTLNNIKDLYLAHLEYENLIRINAEQIFDENQYYSVCKQKLFGLISTYLRNKISNTVEKKAVSKLLKEYISNSSELLRLKKLTFKEKVIYMMYSKCNCLLVLVYFIYSCKNNLFSYILRK